MQTFTVGFGRIWWTKAFGRNALVRSTDRVEAWVGIAAVLMVILATPIAGAIGTSVHDAHAQLYVTQAQTRQQVTATAIEAGRRHVVPNEISYSVAATWVAAGRDHVDVIDWPNQAKIGDERPIWVNAEGEHVKPPPGRSRAGADAVAAALSIWLGVAATAAAFVYAARLILDRRRSHDWDGEVYANHGGPRHH
jgi:hypothetical protein